MLREIRDKFRSGENWSRPQNSLLVDHNANCSITDSKCLETAEGIGTTLVNFKLLAQKLVSIHQTVCFFLAELLLRDASLCLYLLTNCIFLSIIKWLFFADCCLAS